LEQVQPARVAADEIHRQVAADIQQQLRREAAAAAAAPVVQRRPTPEPFTTLPLPSNLLAFSLPEPVRLARAGGIFPALSSPPGLERMLQQHPHVGLVPDAGAASISLSNVFGLGNDVFDGLIAAGHKLVAVGPDGSLYELPGSMLRRFYLPYDAMQQLLQQQGKVGDPAEALLQLPAAPAAPNPDAAIVVPARKPAIAAAPVVRAPERLGPVELDVPEPEERVPARQLPQLPVEAPVQRPAEAPVQLLTTARRTVGGALGGQQQQQL
jgi:hypothetical protein